jgi:hypothetical protein
LVADFEDKPASVFRKLYSLWRLVLLFPIICQPQPHYSVKWVYRSLGKKEKKRGGRSLGSGNILLEELGRRFVAWDGRVDLAGLDSPFFKVEDDPRQRSDSMAQPRMTYLANSMIWVSPGAP